MRAARTIALDEFLNVFHSLGHCRVLAMQTCTLNDILAQLIERCTCSDTARSSGASETHLHTHKNECAELWMIHNDKMDMTRARFSNLTRNMMSRTVTACEKEVPKQYANE